MSQKNVGWQLPDGVSPGTWDYAESASIAGDYDEYFADHGLFALDQSLLRRHLKPGNWVVDLGCGTGRVAITLATQGHHVVGVDLSQAMLDAVQAKSETAHARVETIRANLVDLDGFNDNSFDAAVCMFSTLGMIRGAVARERVFSHVQRLLVPSGLFVFQIHNYWAHLWQPSGPWWMLRNAVRSVRRRDVQIGDKLYPYRGIPDMYLHSFRFREIRGMLARFGFELVELVPLNATQSAALNLPALCPNLRASGWLFVVRNALS